MAFLLGFHRVWYEFAHVIEVSFYLKLVRVVAEYGTVVIALSYIGKTRRAFRNEHSLVPVIFGSFMGQSEP